MSITIELSPEEEGRLVEAAARQGVPVQQFARQTLLAHLPGGVPDDPTLALFAQWEAEDGTDDPDEIADRVRDGEELRAGLNANRAASGEPPLFP